MSKKTLNDLKQVMKKLRSTDGCPWDQKQTPKSLTPYAVEEALELEDAIHNKTSKDVLEELGDLLFQVVFQAQMAEENKHFDLDDVIDHLTKKMIDRHPHVFAKTETLNNLSAEDVKNKWEKDKHKKSDQDSLFAIPTNFPSLLSAYKIGKKTRTINFDWNTPQEIFQHFLSETEELKEAIEKNDPENQMEEIGDCLFTLAQVARHLSVDPEKALRMSNKKVVDRILTAHKISNLSWDDFTKLSIEKKEILWQKVKKGSK